MALTKSPDVRPDIADDETLDAVFKALASKPRRQILMMLATGAGADDERCCGSDEVCACVFSEQLGLGAPTVSHHMKILVDAGLVSADKRGLWVYYRLEAEVLNHLINEFTSLVSCVNGGCR